MTSKLVHFFLATLCAFSLTALAQTSSAASNCRPLLVQQRCPAAPTGTKIATIALYEAVGATNEGQRELEALSKKLDPKQSELKAQNDELDSLKKQLQTRVTNLTTRRVAI